MEKFLRAWASPLKCDLASSSLSGAGFSSQNKDKKSMYLMGLLYSLFST